MKIRELFSKVHYLIKKKIDKPINTFVFYSEEFKNTMLSGKLKKKCRKHVIFYFLKIYFQFVNIFFIIFKKKLKQNHNNL
jgi:hypothetical protein